MAHTAHLTTTSSGKPSIFEFIAQDSLNKILHPAAKRIIDVFYERYPQFSKVRYWFEEFYLGGNVLLQYYYLTKYGSSFAESFYGLQRVPIQDAVRSYLSSREVVLSVLTLSLAPYLRNKLNTKAEELYFKDVPRNQKLWKDIIIKTNSAIQISMNLLEFVQHLRFLSGTSDFNSPLLWLSRVKLKYGEPNEEQFNLRNFLPIFLQRSLELSAFFLQFYQWWQSENSQSLGALPTPPPPEGLQENEELSGICPLCRKQRKVDTALSVSGYVFCFACINTYVRNYQVCPVTNIPANFNDLIRIYPPN